MFRSFFICAISLVFISAGVSSPSVKEDKNKPLFEPWWTGPLLAPAGAVVGKNHFNIQPYYYYFYFNGVYTRNWGKHATPIFRSQLFQLPAKYGITENLEVVANPQFVINNTQGRSSASIADTPVGIGLQVINRDDATWVPDVKMDLAVAIPLGKFRNLDPEKIGTDAGGIGSWATKLSINMAKVLVLGNGHPMRLRLSTTFTSFSSVHVSGFNAFGGGFGTKGKVHPGFGFHSVLAGEYSITQNWVAALDIDYLHFNRTTFNGILGKTVTGDAARVGAPESSQLSLAPAIEYNFNEHIGAIGGVWFSILDRNSPAFITPVIAVNFYY